MTFIGLASKKRPVVGDRSDIVSNALANQEYGALFFNAFTIVAEGVYDPHVVIGR
jgi:hypothetical protein